MDEWNEECWPEMRCSQCQPVGRLPSRLWPKALWTACGDCRSLMDTVFGSLFYFGPHEWKVELLTNGFVHTVLLNLTLFQTGAGLLLGASWSWGTAVFAAWCRTCAPWLWVKGSLEWRSASSQNYPKPCIKCFKTINNPHLEWHRISAKVWQPCCSCLSERMAKLTQISLGFLVTVLRWVYKPTCSHHLVWDGTKAYGWTSKTNQLLGHPSTWEPHCWGQISPQGTPAPLILLLPDGNWEGPATRDTAAQNLGSCLKLQICSCFL